MKNIYAMIIVTILIFILSFDILFYTNVFIDIALVLIYLILVGQSALNLETDIEDLKKEYILTEKNTAVFAPMVFMPFLGIAYEFGYIAFGINILVIVLIYVYVLTSLKRNTITINEDQISVNYLNKNKSSILFKEIDKVEFNWFYNYISLSNAKGDKVILDITLKDFIVVIKAIKVNVPPEMYNMAFSRLTKFYKAFLLKSNIKYLE